MERSATITGNSRFNLIREWLPKKPRMMWLMCNPSTADERFDDPTVCRCIKFASEHGCGSIEVVNLWSYRATQPADLWAALAQLEISHDHLIRNVDYICTAAQRATVRVLAFGVDPVKRQQEYVKHIFNLVAHCGAVHALGTNKDGWPLHPLARGKLAIRNGTRLKPWSWPKEEEKKP